MEVNLIEVLLGFISFLATTIVGLYLKSIYKNSKEYKSFLVRLNSIVGLGGRILYNDGIDFNLYQVEKIDKQGMVLKGHSKTIFVPISKLMGNDIIVPDINYENIIKEEQDVKNATEQEIDDFRHKRVAEIYSHTFKEMIKSHIIPEFEKITKK